MTVVDPIALTDAQHVVDHLVSEAKKTFGKPICAAVCDPYGFLIAFSRADGGPVRSIALSQQKAYTCARIGSGTDAFLERLRRENI